MRRLVPSTLLLIGVTASLAAGCDLFKPKPTDSGLDGAVVTPAAPEPAAPPATPGAPVTPAAPLNPATPTHPSTPAVKTDGGAVTDAGKAADGAAPTPTTPIPPFPPFDAGALKGFDAGGLFRVPDGGFTPPPWPR